MRMSVLRIAAALALTLLGFAAPASAHAATVDTPSVESSTAAAASAACSNKPMKMSKGAYAQGLPRYFTHERLGWVAAGTNFTAARCLQGGGYTQCGYPAGYNWWVEVKTSRSTYFLPYACTAPR